MVQRIFVGVIACACPLFLSEFGFFGFKKKQQSKNLINPNPDNFSRRTAFLPSYGFSKNFGRVGTTTSRVWELLCKWSETLPELLTINYVKPLGGKIIREKNFFIFFLKQ